MKIRIACLYWPTSSCGGIATAGATFQWAARRIGDTFDVLRCPNAKTLRPQLFDKPRWIRGGDSKIWIDGEISHNPLLIEDAARWLEENYDALFILNAVPHPIKSYGLEPHWLEIFRQVRLPKFIRVGDAHYETYRWIDDAFPYCKAIFVNQTAYASALPKGVKIEWLPLAFRPDPEADVVPRLKERWVLWAAQWKTVKGAPGFVKVLKDIDTPLALTQSGVYYYTLRSTEDWQLGVGVDHFFKDQAYQATLRGPLDHIYYGFQPPEVARRFLAKCHGSLNLQGYEGGRRKEYQNGSINNTEIEALWAGCRPILHRNALKSSIPNEHILPVDSAADLPKACREVVPIEGAELRRAREYVATNHNAIKIYQTIREAVLR